MKPLSRGKDPEALKKLPWRLLLWRIPKNTEEEWAKVMYGFSLKEQEGVAGKTGGSAGESWAPIILGRPGAPSDAETMFIPCKARGVLWYQGESDEDMQDIYDRLFREAMIGCWRESFCQEPVLFCQHLHCCWLGGTGKISGCAGVWRRQDVIWKAEVPGKGKVVLTSVMAESLECGERKDIHPRRQQQNYAESAW